MQFGVSALLLVHSLLRPSGGYVSRSRAGSLTVAMIAFAAFALFSIAFWSYFRYRPARALNDATSPDRAHPSGGEA